MALLTLSNHKESQQSLWYEIFKYAGRLACWEACTCLQLQASRHAHTHARTQAVRCRFKKFLTDCTARIFMEFDEVMVGSWHGGKMYCEACCGGMKKWDTMFFLVDP